MPNHTRPIAYLCIRYMTEFSDKQILRTRRLAIEGEVEQYYSMKSWMYAELIYKKISVILLIISNSEFIICL
jgi:hypothetical protein